MNVSGATSSVASTYPFDRPAPGETGPNLISTDLNGPGPDAFDQPEASHRLMFADGAGSTTTCRPGNQPAVDPKIPRSTTTSGSGRDPHVDKPDTSKDRLDKILKDTTFGSREQLERLTEFRNDVANEAWEQGKYGTWLQNRIAANLFGNVGGSGGFPGLIAGSVRIRSSRAARREVMRLEKMPLTEQPRSQSSPRGPGNTPAGRELVYDTAAGPKHVQHQLADRNHDPHWEAGHLKRHLQTDPAGRKRLASEKSKVDEFAPEPAPRPSAKIERSGKDLK
jgi:hypothetical protein